MAKEYVRRLGELSLYRIQDQLGKAVSAAAWHEVRRWHDVQLRAIRLMSRYHRRQAFKRHAPRHP